MINENLKNLTDEEVINVINKIVTDNEDTELADLKLILAEASGRKLEKKYNKEVILKKEIDPEILGGIYVRIGNDVIDGTVKTRLDDLEKLMLATE